MTTPLQLAIDPEFNSPERELNRTFGWSVPNRSIPRTEKGWRAALHGIQRDLLGAEKQLALDFEGRCIYRYSNHNMFRYGGMWHTALTYQLQRLMTVLRAARQRFPGVSWGLLEG